MPDNVNFSNQIHDFDLGIHPYPDGLFWTTRIHSHQVDADAHEGRASLRVKGLACPDYGSIPNALANGPFVQSEVSFDVEWFGPATPAAWSTSDFTFEGMNTQASFRWAAREAGGAWRSTSAPQEVSTAFVGMERNGVFR